MADNEIDMHSKAISKQQKQEKPSSSQLQSSSHTSTPIQNDDCNESSVEGILIFFKFKFHN